MKYTPKSESELNQFPLIPEGEYDFVIRSASDETSKSGNEMIKLLIEIWDGESHLGNVFDYLLEAMPAKLRHCCDACGLLTEYEVGVLQASVFVGKSGKLKLKIKKDADGKYSDRNVVEDYICRPPKPLHATRTAAPPYEGAQTSSPQTDGDLPF